MGAGRGEGGACEDEDDDGEGDEMTERDVFPGSRYEDVREAESSQESWE